MSKDTERLNKMVQAAFFSLHQKPEITHGLVLNLFQAPGSSDVLFPVYGASGGLSRQLVYYLRATHFTNAVQMGFEDTYPEVEQRMAIEMARLQGFIAAMSDQWTQPRITNLDGGDLGIPWKLGGQMSESESSSKLSIERHEPHAGEYRTYGDIKRTEVPLLRTRAELDAFHRETLQRDRARIADIQSPLVQQAQEAVTHAPPGDGPFTIEPAPTCECGAKQGESHFQFCPMWQDLLEVTDATQAE